MLAFSTNGPSPAIRRGEMTSASTPSAECTEVVGAPNGASQSVTTTWTRWPAATRAPASSFVMYRSFESRGYLVHSIRTRIVRIFSLRSVT